MKIYLERHNGYIDVKKKIKTSPYNPHDLYRIIKTVKDTPENFADILRWANLVGHVVEER